MFSNIWLDPKHRKEGKERKEKERENNWKEKKQRGI